jgi:hypothetical protein
VCHAPPKGEQHCEQGARDREPRTTAIPSSAAERAAVEAVPAILDTKYVALAIG